MAVSRTSGIKARCCLSQGATMLSHRPSFGDGHFKPSPFSLHDSAKNQPLEGLMVPRRGLEPPLLAEHGPEPCASTNSAIWAGGAHVSGRAGAVNAVFRSGGTIGQGSRGRCSPESGEQDFRSLPYRFPYCPAVLVPCIPSLTALPWTRPWNRRSAGKRSARRCRAPA